MSRNAALAFCLAVTLLTFAVPPASGQAVTPDTVDAAATSGPCGFGVALICAADTAIDVAGDVAGDLVGGAADAAGDAVMGGLVDWAAAGAAWLVSKIGTQIDRSTRPALGSAWFGKQYAAVRELAILLALPFLLLAITHAVLRQDLRLLAHSTLVALPLSVLLTFAAVTLVELGLAITDWMTAQALRSFSSDAEQAFERVATLLAPATGPGPALPGLVIFLASALTALLALVVWIELVLREATIYVAVSFLPIAFVALVWRPTATWARRLAEWLGAIVLAKFTIAVAFGVAASALSHGAGGGGLSTLLAGCAVLLVAALSPWVLLRMIPGSMTAASGMHRGVVRKGVGSTAGTTTATVVARQLIMRSFATAAPASRNASSAVPRPPRPSEPPGLTLHQPEQRNPTPVR